MLSVSLGYVVHKLWRCYTTSCGKTVPGYSLWERKSLLLRMHRLVLMRAGSTPAGYAAGNRFYPCGRVVLMHTGSAPVDWLC